MARSRGTLGVMDSLSAVLVLAGLALAVLVGYALAAARRPPAPEADPAAVEYRAAFKAATGARLVYEVTGTF